MLFTRIDEQVNPIILKIRILSVGKTEKGWVGDGLEVYLSRLKKVAPVEWVELEASTNPKRQGDEAMKEEGVRILKQCKPGDYLVLLDEHGAEMDSVVFSTWMNKKMVSVQGDLIFVIGGAFGFHAEVKDKSREIISLSKMTFTHQMVRVFFAEQLYRAFSILRNEPYHHS